MLKAIAALADPLRQHHSEAVGRLVASPAGVKFLNALRVRGAGGLKLAEHSQAVATLRSTDGGKSLLKALQVAGQGVAMPGVPAAEPRPAAADPERSPTRTADELGAMMKDPRYWRDKDPAFVGEVTRGFAKLYPSEVQTAVIAPSSSSVAAEES